MILIYYIASIILCKYTNSPIIGIFICVISSIPLGMTVMESIGAFAGSVCSYHIKDSRRFWRIVLINGIVYSILVLIFGGSIDLRLIFTFGIAWSNFAFRYYGFV